MTSDDVQIEFRYKSFEANDWQTLAIGPTEYLDLRDRRVGERIDFGFPSRHSDPRVLVDLPKECIRAIHVRERDPLEGTERSRFYAYWNFGRCVLVRCQSNEHGEPWDELIVNMEVVPGNCTARVNFSPDGDGGFEVLGYMSTVDGVPREFLPENEKPSRLSDQ